MEWEGGEIMAVGAVTEDVVVAEEDLVEAEDVEVEGMKLEDEHRTACSHVYVMAWRRAWRIRSHPTERSGRSCRLGAGIFL